MSNTIKNIFYVDFVDFIEKNQNIMTKIKTQYLNLLSRLTRSDDISNDLFYNNLKQIDLIGKIIIGIIYDGDDDFQIVGSGTIIIEPKIIRGGMSVGHIEDIVVRDDFRGNGIAQSILNKLKEYGQNEKNCYKIILDCDESVVNVYKKNGFVVKGIQMAEYFEN